MRAFLCGAATVLTLAAVTPAQPQAGLLANDPEVAGAEHSMSNRALVAMLADRLQRLYVDAEYGHEYADSLRAYAAIGNYDRVSGQPLADLLNADLQTIHRDPRLLVRVGAPAPSPAPPMPPATVIAPVEGERWIMPGVAYVRINRFPGTRESLAAIDRFMAAHAGARALVFDLRHNASGGLLEVDRILPWLFAAPTRLATITLRADAAAVDAPVSIPDLAAMQLVTGAPGMITREHWITPLGDPRLRQARVTVLVSRQTRSAAEHMAMVLQASGRGAVVGEPTAGIDHFGGSVALANGFSAWIPVGRIVSAGTGKDWTKDWEGTGVAPNLAAPADTALRAVLVREGADPARAATLAAQAEAARAAVAPAAHGDRDAARARIVSEFSRPASNATPSNDPAPVNPVP